MVRFADLDHKIVAPISNVNFGETEMQLDFAALDSSGPNFRFFGNTGSAVWGHKDKLTPQYSIQIAIVLPITASGITDHSMFARNGLQVENAGLNLPKQHISFERRDREFLIARPVSSLCKIGSETDGATALYFTQNDICLGALHGWEPKQEIFKKQVISV